MRLGAIIANSIFLIEQIKLSKTPASLILKSHIRKNKYIGSKDKKLLYEIIFSTLKKYYSLIEVCNNYKIPRNIRNLILFNCYNKYKHYEYDDFYLGKYSITREFGDREIYKKAINHEKEIIPSLPNWMEEKLSVIDKKKNDLFQSILKYPRFDIAVNKTKYSRTLVKKKLKEFNISSHNTKTSNYGITIFDRVPHSNIEKIKQDMFGVQDEGSQLMTLLINVKPNMKVLDYCAGKGKKTIFINNMLRHKGKVFAYDKYEDRLEVLKKRIKKLKLKNIITIASFKNYRNFFDLIICDVPCSGIGVWRRRPENIVRLKRNDLNDLKNTQYNILIESANLCKKNGLLVYITCSILYDENEGQIKNFVNNHKNFGIVSLKSRLKNFFPKNNIDNNAYGFTLNPNVLNSDGYFISILKKIS